MYIVLLCSLIALLLTHLETKGKMNGGMKWGVILTAFLGVIHYDYGNDYMPYYEVFKQVTSYPFDIDAILAKEYYRDPGWVILCFLFKPIGGFFMMVATLNVIQNCIVYKFIKKYVDRKWWTMAVFIYLFVTSYYLMEFSMMRQIFVVIMFLGMWPYIIERKWWIPLIVIYLCSFVHGSALVLLPFAFWGFIPMDNAKYVGVCYAIVLMLLWLFGDTLNTIFQFAMTMDDEFSEYADRYENAETGLKLGFGFIINMIPFVLSVIFLLSKNRIYTTKEKSLVALGAIAFLIIPFGQIIRLVSRISTYFGIFSIAALPLIYGNIKNKMVRFGFVTLYVLITIYDYWLFFNEGAFVKSYSTFHTIFSQL